GPLYYIGVFILGGIPFSAVFLPSFWMPLKAKRELRDSDPVARLCFFASIAAIFTYLVFSSAATKLPHYVMPAFPWLSILTVCFFHRLHRGDTPKKWVMATVRVLMQALPLAATLVVLLFPLGVPPALKFALKIMRPDSGEYALPMSTPLATYFVFPVALITLYLAIHPPRILKAGMPYKALGSLLAGIVALSFAGIVYGSIGVNAVALEGKRMFVDVGRSASPEAELATYGLWKQSMSFYTQRSLIRFRYKYDADLESLEKSLKKPVPVYVMTRTRVLDKLDACESFVPIRQYDGYFLGGNLAAKTEFEARNENTSSTKGEDNG
ncbi:MAG: hypothetical protein JW808_06640, partial [Victivallales bacterium]|nr:hypothetical protein [Victivallales bacterium]